MSIRTVVIVILAIVFGVSAAVGVNIVIRNPGTAEKAETVPVVVTTEAVLPGKVLKKEHLDVRQWPKHLPLPKGVVTEVEKAAGQTTISWLIAGEPILEGKLESSISIAAMIPDGWRAYPIKAPDVTAAVAGLIQPTNYVDVIATIKGGGTNDPTGGGISKTILQRVQVFAIDQRTEPSEDGKFDKKELRSVTLLVKPEEAQRLDLAQEVGKLRLSLRNNKDEKMVDASQSTTLREMKLFGEPEQGPAVEKPRIGVITTMKGQSVDYIQFRLVDVPDKKPQP